MSKLSKFVKLSSALCATIAVCWSGYEVFRPVYDGTVGIARGSAYAPVRDRHVEAQSFSSLEMARSIR